MRAPHTETSHTIPKLQQFLSNTFNRQLALILPTLYTAFDPQGTASINIIKHLTLLVLVLFFPCLSLSCYPPNFLFPLPSHPPPWLVIHGHKA